MNIGNSIISHIVKHGDTEKFEHLSPDENVIFADIDKTVWKLLLNHYRTHGKSMSEEIFREHYHENIYRLDDKDYEASELTKLSEEKILASRLALLTTDIIDAHDVQDYQKALDKIAAFQAPVHGRASTWSPMDLSEWFKGEAEALVPELGERDDGFCLFYPAKTHMLIGLSEAGKSWLALKTCAQEMAKGNDVAYIDFEDSLDGILSRLSDLSEEELIMKHFSYIRPEEQISSGTVDSLAGKSFIVVDGIGEALSLHGLNNEEGGFLTLNSKLLRPLSLTGAAVVGLDHMPKAKDNQNSAIGTVYKKNAVSGASYFLRNREPFGLGRTGLSVLEVDKDRPGQVRKESVDGGVVAELHIVSDDPDVATAVKIKAPVSLVKVKSENARVNMRTVMLGRGEPMSRDQIAIGMKGNKSSALTEIDLAMKDGWLEEVTEGRWTKYTWKDKY